MTFTREEFIEYLKGTLIPDLEESGKECTAADFAICVEFMQGATTVELKDDQVVRTS